MKLADSLKTMLAACSRRLGYEVFPVPKCGGDRRYEVVRPNATYAPWNADRAFLDTCREIAANTLVDSYRCFELWTLVEQVASLDGSLMEVGVWKGGTGALIARRASLSGISSPVYLCDTFRGVVKATDRDSHYEGGEHSDTSRGVVDDLLARMGLKNVQILEGIFPDETARFVVEDRFRFCHVDVDVYQSAKEVTEWIWDRLVLGGVVVYDDYGFGSCDGVAAYVDEQRARTDRLTIHNLNGHAVVVKIKPGTGSHATPQRRNDGWDG